MSSNKPRADEKDEGAKNEGPPGLFQSGKNLVSSAAETGLGLASSVMHTGAEIVHSTTDTISEMVGGKKEKDTEEPEKGTAGPGIFESGKKYVSAATSSLTGMLGFGHQQQQSKKCKNPDCACVDCKCRGQKEQECKSEECTCMDCPSGGLKNKKCKNPACTCENCQCEEGTCSCGK
jgi:hypothetical protein